MVIWLWIAAGAVVYAIGFAAMLFVVGSADAEQPTSDVTGVIVPAILWPVFGVLLVGWMLADGLYRLGARFDDQVLIHHPRGRRILRWIVRPLARKPPPPPSMTELERIEAAERARYRIWREGRGQPVLQPAVDVPPVDESVENTVN